jgi:hypothetical protein
MGRPRKQPVSARNPKTTSPTAGDDIRDANLGTVTNGNLSQGQPSDNDQQQRGARSTVGRGSGNNLSKGGLSGNDGAFANAPSQKKVFSESGKQPVDLGGNGVGAGGGLLEAIKNAPVEHNRIAFLQRAAQMAPAGIACEFGVFKGDSLRLIRDVRKPPVYGFDSFNGLPEEWDFGDQRHKKGHFKTAIPTDFANGVHIIEGEFKDTLKKWANEIDEPIMFAHIDCDLYSSALEVLNQINHKLVSGSIVVFDELINLDGSYPQWESGEWKALMKWGRKIKPVLRTNSQQVAFLVI